MECVACFERDCFGCEIIRRELGLDQDDDIMAEREADSDGEK